MAPAVDLTAVGGRWLRHVPAGADPQSRPLPPADNRWQRGDVVDALYLCDEADCVWAEWYRHLAERGLPPHVSLPRDLWTYEIEALQAVDLRTPEQLARVGLPVPAPGRRGWPRFQAVGEQLHAAGHAGIITASAARPRSVVLAVFLPAPETVRPVGRPRRVDRVPAPPTGMRT